MHRPLIPAIGQVQRLGSAPITTLLAEWQPEPVIRRLAHPVIVDRQQAYWMLPTEPVKPGESIIAVLQLEPDYSV